MTPRRACIGIAATAAALGIAAVLAGGRSANIKTEVFEAEDAAPATSLSNFVGPAVDPTPPGNPPPPCGPDVMTHSATENIVQFNSISCNAGGLHTDNSYYRTFTLADFGYGPTFDVCNVRIGIEVASASSGSQPLEVYLYDTTDLLSAVHGAEIGFANFTVSDVSLALADLAVVGTTNTGELTVEIFTPEGQTAGNSFFIGSNADGQSAPSYILAPDCGTPIPTDIAASGFPDMHIVMTVEGATGGAPANDLCDDAEAVAMPSATLGTTNGATDDFPPACGLLAPGVWYSVIGNGNFFTATTCSPNTNYDTMMSVFEGPCTDLVCVGSSDDDGGCPESFFHSTVSWCTEPGVEYFILVSGFFVTGDFELTLSEVPLPPVPDECADAEVINPASLPTTINAFTVCATTAPTDPLISCGLGGPAQHSNTVWYSYTPPGPGGEIVYVDTNGTDYDTVLAVWTGACPTPDTEVACDDDGGDGLQSMLSFCAQAGTTYLIEVADWSLPGGGDLVLNISSKPDCNENCIPDDEDTAPEFDPDAYDALGQVMCDDAEHICPGATYFDATDPLSPSITNPLVCGVFTGANSHYYRYRPSWDGLAFVVGEGPPVMWLVSVHTNCPVAGWNQIACNDFSQGATFYAYAGQEYIIRLAGFGYAFGPYEMELTGPDCLANVDDRDRNGVPDECQCFADVNGDDIVDTADYALILQNLGPCGGCPEDVDGSGVVDFVDAQIVLANQGPCPFPGGFRPVTQSSGLRIGQLEQAPASLTPELIQRKLELESGPSSVAFTK